MIFLEKKISEKFRKHEKMVGGLSTLDSINHACHANHFEIDIRQKVRRVHWMLTIAAQ